MSVCDCVCVKKLPNPAHYAMTDYRAENLKLLVKLLKYNHSFPVSEYA